MFREFSRRLRIFRLSGLIKSKWIVFDETSIDIVLCWPNLIDFPFSLPLSFSLSSSLFVTSNKRPVRIEIKEFSPLFGA